MAHVKGPEINQPTYPSDISMFQLIQHSMKKHGDITALVEGWSGASVSFSDLLQHSNSIAKCLQRAGIIVGDHVVFCCEKSILALESLLGVILCGATPVIVLDTHADRLDRLTVGHTVKAVFHDPLQAVQVTESISRMMPTPVLVATTDAEDPTMASLLDATPQELEECRIEDPDNYIFLVLCSSGTTGDPKGVAGKDPRKKFQVGDINAKRTGPLLISTPLHMCSFFTHFFFSLVQGITLVMSDPKDPTHNLQLIEKYKIKDWCEGTGVMARYFKLACPSQYDLSSLEYFDPVGDIMLPSVAYQFYHQVLGERDIQVLQSYGNTEIGHLTSLLTRASEVASLGLGAAGMVDAGAELKIVDSEGATVEYGVVGEIWAKSSTMHAASGYWGPPDVAVPIDQDGYFHTGDIGYLDHRGFLYIRGRVGDTIEYRGTKTYAAEVVDELLWHEDVLDAGVVAVPHPEDGQHPRALVVLRPGASVQAEEIVTFVDGRVQGRDHLRLRGGVTVVDKLPRVCGKMMRHMLHQLADSTSASVSSKHDCRKGKKD